MDKSIISNLSDDDLETFFYKFLKDKIKDKVFIEKNNINQTDINVINKFLEKDPEFIKSIIKEIITVVKEENIELDLSDIPNLVFVVKEIITMNLE